MDTGLKYVGLGIGRNALITSVLVATGYLVCFAKLSEWQSDEGLENNEQLALLWSTTGTSAEDEIKTTLDLWENNVRFDWEQQYTTAIVWGKNWLKGQDIVKKSVLLELEPIFGQWFDITVMTPSGKVFTTSDICARLALPDLPGYIPIEPCQVTSAFDCFKEMHNHIPVSYKTTDKTKKVALPTNPTLMVYQGYWWRPSYKALSDPMIKATISKGCPIYSLGAVWTLTLLVAQRSLDNNKILVDGKYMGIYNYYEGPKRMMFRLSHPSRALNPKLPTQGALTEKQWVYELKTAVDLHIDAWKTFLLNHNALSNNLEFACLTNEKDLVKSLEDDLKKPPWFLYLIGFALMVILMGIFVNFRRGQDSRFWVNVVGLMLVIISLLAAFGFIARLNIRFNPVMLTALPFLLIGLGLDDMFVIVRAFNQVGRQRIIDMPPSETLAEVLESCGTGVLLTSLCNSVGFGLGAMIPVMALSDFCISAMIGAVINWLTMMTLLLPLLHLEANRVKESAPEPFCCCCQIGFCCCCLPDDCACSPKPQPEPKWKAEDVVVRFTSLRYAPFVCHPVVYTFSAFLVLTLVGLSTYSIAKKDIGYSPASIATRGSDEYRALKVYFDNFNVFPSYLFWWDVDVPVNQGNMDKLYKDITATEFAEAFPLPSYLTSFQMYNPHMVSGIGDPGKPTKKQWWQAWHAFSEFPANATVAFPKLFSVPPDYRWMYADYAKANEFTYWPAPVKNERKLRLSYFPFLASGISDPDDFVTIVEDCKDVIHNNPHFQDSKGYVYGTLFVYWDVFIKLEGILLRVFYLDLGVIFVLNAICLMSIVSAFLSSLMCFLIVIEVYGICMRVVQFNIFMASVLLAAAGIAVEDVAHSIAYFVVSRGSVSQRLAKSMSMTFPAIIQGSLSTMLSIMPLAFHPIPFYPMYYFFPFMMICCCGLLNGLFFTPSLLALSNFITSPCMGKTKNDTEVSV